MARPPRTDREPRPRRRLAPALAALAVVALAVAVGLFAPPAVYRRTAAFGPDHPAKDAFNAEVVNGLSNAFLDRSGATRVDLAVTEAMAGARLARWVADRRAAGEPVAPALAALRIGFEPGRIVLATRLGRGAGSIVVSQAFAPEVAEAGRLRLSTVSLRAGRLPLPTALARHLEHLVAGRVARLERRATEAAAGGEGAGGAAEETAADLALWRAVRDALAGEPVVLGTGDHVLHLDRIAVERGVLHVEGRPGAHG